MSKYYSIKGYTLSISYNLNTEKWISAICSNRYIFCPHNVEGFVQERGEHYNEFLNGTKNSYLQSPCFRRIIDAKNYCGGNFFTSKTEIKNHFPAIYKTSEFNGRENFIKFSTTIYYNVKLKFDEKFNVIDTESSFINLLKELFIKNLISKIQNMSPMDVIEQFKMCSYTRYSEDTEEEIVMNENRKRSLNEFLNILSNFIQSLNNVKFIEN